MNRLINLTPQTLKALVIICALVCQFSVAQAEGGTSGGGGVSIHCNGTGEGTDFPITGFYFYDYAVNQVSHREWFIYQNDPDQHLQKVTEKLSLELPWMFSSEILNEYVEKVINKKWKDSKGSLTPSESIDLSKLPINCTRNQKEVRQIVSYYNGEYYYNGNDLVELNNLGVAQKSSVNIHELFRSSMYPTGHTEAILRWNGAIHSSDFFTLNGKPWLEFLRNRGAISIVNYNDILFYRGVQTFMANEDSRELKEKFLIDSFQKLIDQFRQNEKDLKQASDLVSIREDKCAAYAEFRRVKGDLLEKYENSLPARGEYLLKYVREGNYDEIKKHYSMFYSTVTFSTDISSDLWENFISQFEYFETQAVQTEKRIAIRNCP
ncbi:MAG: hypothetical protein ACXWRA_05635 [Pseudobdellovibrionaceae bacterium]